MRSRTSLTTCMMMYLYGMRLSSTKWRSSLKTTRRIHQFQRICHRKPAALHGHDQSWVESGLQSKNSKVNLINSDPEHSEVLLTNTSNLPRTLIRTMNKTCLTTGENKTLRKLYVCSKKIFWSAARPKGRLFTMSILHPILKSLSGRPSSWTESGKRFPKPSSTLHFRRKTTWDILTNSTSFWEAIMQPWAIWNQ